MSISVNRELQSQFFKLVEFENAEQLSAFLDQHKGKVDVNAYMPGGGEATPIFRCMRYDPLPGLAKALLKAGADVNRGRVGNGLSLPVLWMKQGAYLLDHGEMSRKQGEFGFDLYKRFKELGQILKVAGAKVPEAETEAGRRKILDAVSGPYGKGSTDFLHDKNSFEREVVQFWISNCDEVFKTKSLEGDDLELYQSKMQLEQAVHVSELVDRMSALPPSQVAETAPGVKNRIREEAKERVAQADERLKKILSKYS